MVTTGELAKSEEEGAGTIAGKMADSTLKSQDTAGADDGQNDAGQNEGGVGHPVDQADNTAHDANVEILEGRGREEDPSPPLV
ncbi:unnamed protein product, partial [Ectocarpus sp. 12 AP-2014]